MTNAASSNIKLQKTFSALSQPKKAARTRAFALRLTERERTYLEQKAGNMPLGTYCRKVLLGDREENRLVLRKPKTDEKQLALVLATLGDSRLSSNVNQLAKHANMGTLDIGAETERELQYAAQAIVEMRKALFIALGLKP